MHISGAMIIQTMAQSRNGILCYIKADLYVLIKRAPGYFEEKQGVAPIR